MENHLEAVEARYAALLQELTQLFYVREQLRRVLSEGDEAERGGGPVADRFDQGADWVTLAPGPGLRLLRGSEEPPANAALRLAQKQDTRARLRVVAGGLAAC